MSPKNLLGLLEQAALDSSKKQIVIYPPGDLHRVEKRLRYDELLRLAQVNAPLIQQIPGIDSKTVVLLHFDNHLDGFEWLWSTIAAGNLPAISTPLTNDAEERRKHLLHLQVLLKDPVVITRDHLVSEFAALQHVLNIRTVEDIKRQHHHFQTTSPLQGSFKQLDDPAVLMLTSGSTGNAKAVTLRHGQILKAVQGKIVYHGNRNCDSFLNWIGLDHVANLTEIHLHAMALAAEQVHIHAADLLADPFAFIELIDRHRIAYSFAPNFFLASLRKVIERAHPLQPVREPDLCCLRALISGGEPNVTETCEGVTKLMERYGSPSSFIRPGFGMTETCAGCIYSKKCPAYDIANNWEFTSLGSCIPGLKMRISREDGSVANANEIGNLELSGSVVFSEYYNNVSATSQAFTADGWFITGDQAFIDKSGVLNLTGRAKESVIINGVKHFPQELETAIAEANIDGVTPSYTAVFPHRPKGSQTEALCVVYLPAYDVDDVASRINVRNAISEVTIRQCNVRPYKVIPLDKSLLPKSSLGKLSRTKIRNAFESGAFVKHQAIDEEAVRSWRAAYHRPSSEIERLLLDVFVEVFEVPEDEIGSDTSLFEMGVSSLEMLMLKTRIERSLGLQNKLALITIMSNPTIRRLGTALEREAKSYRAAVVLQPGGSKVPLWLVHPGVGEILIFLNLAKYIRDRPVYALRSRGFDGEAFFKDIPEVVTTYYAAMKEMQPEGPYAIAGYSYGATIAFELTKLFQRFGDEVKFLGIIDQPAHIKLRMRQSDWTSVVLILARFLELISDDYAAAITPKMYRLSKGEVLDHLLSCATPSQLEKMAVDKEKLANWAELALNNHQIARDYEPSGTVPSMDVFYGVPMNTFYAKDKREWLANHLSKWSALADSAPSFHEVDGNHYTILREPHVSTFQSKLQALLQARGL